jgi:hypothetical protein
MLNLDSESYNKLLKSLKDLLFRNAVNQAEFSEFLQSKGNDIDPIYQCEFSNIARDLSRHSDQLNRKLNRMMKIEAKTEPVDLSAR